MKEQRRMMVHTLSTRLPRSVWSSGLVGGLALTLLCPHASVAAEAPRPGSTLAATVVSLADVTQVYGAGFRAGRAMVVNNQQAVQAAALLGADGSQLLRDGRRTGYSAGFAKGGRLFLVNDVDQFRSAAGAGRSFQYFKAFYAHHLAAGTTTRAAAVGNQGVLRTQHIGGQVSASITFRRGRYVADLTITMPGNRLATSDLLRLARIDDSRIERQG
jgi:hypothetical protein